MTAHALPEVTKAVTEQAGRILHTSTLYLNRPMVELAERIAAAVRHPRRPGLLHHLRHRGQRHRPAAGHHVPPLQPDPGAAQQLPRPVLRDGRHHRQPRPGRRPASRPLQTLYVHGGVRSRGPFAGLSDAEFIAACVADLRGRARPGARRRRRADRRTRSRASAGSPRRPTGCSPPSARCSTGTASCGSPTRCRPAGAVPASTSGAGRRTAQRAARHPHLRQGHRQRHVHRRGRGPRRGDELPGRQLHLHLRRQPGHHGRRPRQPRLPARPRPPGQRPPRRRPAHRAAARRRAPGLGASGRCAAAG